MIDSSLLEELLFQARNKKKQRIAAFISIPKNASKSVLRILQLGRVRMQETTHSPVIYEDHQRAKILSQKYSLKDLFLFCFVRNPYDRCVSWYSYHRHLEPYASRSFKEWLMQGAPHHWTVQNQTDYVADQVSPLLQYSFVESYPIDFIGRVETFTTDMNKLIQRLNEACKNHEIDHQFKMTSVHLNRSKRSSDYGMYYDRESQEKAYSLFEQDFRFFGYPAKIKR